MHKILVCIHTWCLWSYTRSYFSTVSLKCKGRLESVHVICVSLLGSCFLNSIFSPHSLINSLAFFFFFLRQMITENALQFLFSGFFHVVKILQK